MKQQLDLTDQSPLKWPDGWERTPIHARKPQGGWRRTWSQYKIALTAELNRMGATSALITRNGPDKERLDPGVAVYFSRETGQDSSWQSALGITNPAPTLDEIDSAYKSLAMKHHPDRGGDVEIFKKLGEHRKRAREWVLGTHTTDHEYVIPCDRFLNPTLNLAAIRQAFAAFRTLERVGVPAILERTFLGFKTALPAHASTEDSNVPTTA